MQRSQLVIGHKLLTRDHLGVSTLKIDKSLLRTQLVISASNYIGVNSLAHEILILPNRGRTLGIVDIPGDIKLSNRRKIITREICILAIRIA